MPLTLYRRHRPDCPNRARGRRWTKCKCPLWVQGSLGGEAVRQSLNLTVWGAAQEKVRGWEASGQLGVAKAEIPTVAEAVGKYLEDAKARNLAVESIKKLRHTNEKLLLAFCASEGIRHLRQLDIDTLRTFRSRWTYSPIAARKRLENLRSFLRFCVNSGWIPTNPAQLIKPPKVKDSPTLPFTGEEMKRILEAADCFWAKGKFGAGNRKRIRGLVLLLRYSGLRVTDAVCLEKARVKDGNLFLYTQKTGTPVRVPLPPKVTAALAEVPNDSPDFVFWNSRCLKMSAVTIWERTLARVFELAKVEGGHAHRFRDTFAVELLLAGVPIDQVSILLGHSSVRITEKHYSPWVKARQDQLEAAVKKAW